MADPRELYEVESVTEYVLKAAAAVNGAALDEEMRAAFGGDYAGLTVAGEDVRVHLLADVADAQDMAAAVLAAHDARVKTVEQAQAEARAATLESLRKPWADWSAGDKDTLLWLLAEDVVSLP
jgi:hypothetical protein